MKKGDKVVCVYNSGFGTSITLGKKYYVLEYRENMEWK